MRCLVFATLCLVSAHAAGAAPHPEPRVIVTVPSVEGPHDRDGVERAARESWGKIIRCYKTTARGRRGEVRLERTIAAAGRVTGARHTHSTLPSTQLGVCLSRSMQGLAMPAASGRSVASMNVRVAPGDAP